MNTLIVFIIGCTICFCVDEITDIFKEKYKSKENSIEKNKNCEIKNKGE